MSSHTVIKSLSILSFEYRKTVIPIDNKYSSRLISELSFFSIVCCTPSISITTFFAGIKKSEFVYSKFGIYGVCEPSALIEAGFDSKLIYKKTSYDGVTIAVAISK